MKLIKKIAAIMFAFMMVVSMSCNVKAAETGEITIDKAVDGQTYTIYKLLDLESYTPEPGTETGIYSYKPNKDWYNFIDTAKDSAGTKYFDINENGYATWKGDKTDSRKAEFAQKALVYAKNEQNGIKGSSLKKEKGITLSFSGLSLGYYLVESNVGALCSLDTTRPTVTIEEKNGEPSVDKTITGGGVLAGTGNSNSVNIGDTINFQTVIHVKKGAKSYVLTDKMSDGLKLNDKLSEVVTSTLHVEARNDDGTINDTLQEGTDYDLEKSANSFTVSFEEGYLKKHETAEYQITVTYSATLTDAAVIGGEGNTNDTYLKYGVDSKSTHSTTTTYTFGIPVFKYTGTDTPLSGAKFQLYTDEPCKNEVNVKLDGTDYLVDSTDTNKNVMTSPASTGEFTIKGLKAGTYYLKETEAPKGYNLLAKTIKVVITDDGQVQVEKNGAVTNVKRVEVQNKSGTLLPSTGGAGTTMIYLVGALLVLGSGVVLASKRRSNSK